MRTAAPAAKWYDGKSAVEHEATVYYREHSQELRICSPGHINDLTPLAVWKVPAIHLLSGKPTDGGAPLVLRLEPDEGQRLIVSEAQAVRTISQWLEGAFQQKKKNRRKRWLLGTVAVWALLAVFYLGSSAIFSLVAEVFPQRWEASLGKASRESVIAVLKRVPGAGMRGICDSGTRSPDLRRMVDRLVQGAPAGGYAFDLLVLDADFVNAFALPGGYMAVSTGLVRECDSPDEFAAVIAHEMAHVTEKHGLGALLRQYTWGSVLRMMGVSDSMTGAIAELVISSSFSRDDEREADALGVERLVGADIDPMAMAGFFGKLAKAEDGGDEAGGYAFTSYISSHPALSERRENIRRQAESLVRGRDGDKSGFSPAMSDAAWERFRALCPGPSEKEDKAMPSPRE